MTIVGILDRAESQPDYGIFCKVSIRQILLLNMAVCLRSYIISNNEAVAKLKTEKLTWFT